MKGIKKKQVRGEGQRCKKILLSAVNEQVSSRGSENKNSVVKLLACLLLIKR
jgi:hypothetical protein